MEATLGSLSHREKVLMKAFARNVAIAVTVSSALFVSACGGSAPSPSDATEATDGDAEGAEGEGEKKPLEGMKGDRMEKADAEE